VGRDDASPVTPEDKAPFRFTGATIDRVVLDVSGERYIDQQAQVRGWFLLD
jgi:arylsulfatase